MAARHLTQPLRAGLAALLVIAAAVACAGGGAAKKVPAASGDLSVASWAGCRMWLVSQGAVDAVATLDALNGNLHAIVDEGGTAAVYVRLGGQTCADGGMGLTAGPGSPPVAGDTVFGVGSLPIEFTMAGIDLLVARGAVATSDRITEYFENVPADKAGITIEHLLTGRSGLPDFFDRPGDWDPDLAWLSREEAETRILASSLRFEPGTRQAHSHAAFGLLAAVIERVSGQPYTEFVSANLLQPAGMNRTGWYGDDPLLPIDQFAIGRGPIFIGLPNIPPNWGPTSWMIMGSGGMFSTLNDLQAYYARQRTGEILGPEASRRYREFGFGVAASERGFYLVHSHRGSETEVLILIAARLGDERVRGMPHTVRALVEQVSEISGNAG